MYQPPKGIDNIYKQEYDEGYDVATLGGKESDNPYMRNGDEREMHYFWYCGFNDFHERN